MPWERQLLSMIESNHMDEESIADLGVAYAAETGDASLYEGYIDALLRPQTELVSPGSRHPLESTHMVRTFSNRSLSGSASTEAWWPVAVGGPSLPRSLYVNSVSSGNQGTLYFSMSHSRYWAPRSVSEDSR